MSELELTMFLEFFLNRNIVLYEGIIRSALFFLAKEKAECSIFNLYEFL
jgi:hypothetical protein